MKRIKKIIIQIFPSLRKKSMFELYTENGNIIIGSNSDTTNLNVFIQDNKQGNCNIRIGDNCILMGSITIYNNKANVVIGDGVFIGPDTKLFCYQGIEIGNDTMISWGCTLIDTNAHSLHSNERINDVSDWKKGPEHKDWSNVKHAPIIIEKKSWIGFNSIINKGVQVKEGTIVGCGSVLASSTDSYSVYAGNPAVFIKKTD
jgi:acetyltransferase-like isoleucine patch superfamily enzyme